MPKLLPTSMQRVSQESWVDQFAQNCAKISSGDTLRMAEDNDRP
mgnify:CR=1 FL=1